jgi:hypothetical protein
MGPPYGPEQQHLPFPAVPGQAWPPRETEGTAVAGLATSIVALIACPLVAIVSLILSSLALHHINVAAGTRGGWGMAVAGVVISIVAMAGWGLLLLVIAI